MNTDPNKINPKDIMAIVHYVHVTKVNPNDYEFIGEDIDNPGKPIRIQGKELLERALSADQFQKEETVSKTQAAEILVASHNKPFTVSFDKSDGKERTLRGRLIRPEPLLGRSMVEDLDIPKPNNVRQVDHRTINWLVVDNTKFNVK